MAATSAMATDVELKLRVWVNKTNIFEEVLKFSSILGSFLDSLRVGGMWGGREGLHSPLLREADAPTNNYHRQYSI